MKNLTDREEQFLELLATGDLRTKEIADRMGVGIKTVERLAQDSKRKVKAATLYGAVGWWWRRKQFLEKDGQK